MARMPVFPGQGSVEIITPKNHPRLTRIAGELEKNARAIEPGFKRPHLAVLDPWPASAKGYPFVYAAKTDTIYMQRKAFEASRKRGFENMYFYLAHEFAHKLRGHRLTENVCVSKTQEMEADLTGAQISGFPEAYRKAYAGAHKKEGRLHAATKHTAQALAIAGKGKRPVIEFDAACRVKDVTPSSATYRPGTPPLTKKYAPPKKPAGKAKPALRAP